MNITLEVQYKNNTFGEAQYRLGCLQTNFESGLWVLAAVGETLQLVAVGWVHEQNYDTLPVVL